MDAIENQDLKDDLVEALRRNFFDISGACESVGVPLDTFNSFRDCEYFQHGLEDARQWRDDFALKKFKELIESGNSQAIIEYQKMLRQSDDKNQALVIRKKSMKYFIETSDTKASVLRTFSDVFGESAKIAEKFYQTAMTEYGLLSPAQRIKAEKKNNSQKMSLRLESGDLSEEDMIRGLLVQALDDAENAEYPGERAKATEQSIKLTQRMEEIQERKRREEESDDTPIHLKVDAVLFQSSPQHVLRVHDQIESIEINRIGRDA